MVKLLEALSTLLLIKQDGSVLNAKQTNDDNLIFSKNMATRGGKREGSGRKKGEATLYSEALKAKIAELVKRDAPELIAAQIAKAKTGDTQAFKELMDRVLGKAPQALTGLDGGALIIQFDSAFRGKE